MEIAGLPLHALIVHAAVVLIPLFALLAIAFAVLPGWRWLTRWPTALAGVGAFALAFLTVQSGEALLEARPFLLESAELREQIETHQDRGRLLRWLTIPFALLAVLSAWTLGGTSALASGRGTRESRAPALGNVLVALLVLASVAVVVLTVLTGDAGARAVWEQP